MSQLWGGLLDGLATILRFFESVAEPVFGVAAWGWAIIMLTVAVRIVLLPLAVKQFSSMRSMQKLQPEIKKIQAKYKADRGLLRTDPEKYKAKRQKQQEATMRLYKEHRVNPAAGCLPLLLQMPIFFALFSVLNGRVPELAGAPFYFVQDLTFNAGSAGLGAWVLILLMGVTTFLTQKLTMATSPAAQQQQQKILLYVMPVMLAVFAVQMPIGVLLYWVTTNVWQMAQQWIMLRGAPDAVPTANLKKA